MQINSSSVIPQSRDRVFRAYRDEMSEVARFMPNIQQINVVKRELVDPGVKLHNEWIGKGEIPRPVQGIVKPDMLRWDDFAIWDNGAWACQWEIKLRVFTDAVKCHGKTRFIEESAGSTRVILAGTLDINLRDIPGVPRMLAGTVGPLVEKFIVALITPNLEQVNTSLAQYLNASGGRG